MESSIHCSLLMNKCGVSFFNRKCYYFNSKFLSVAKTFTLTTTKNKKNAKKCVAYNPLNSHHCFVKVVVYRERKKAFLTIAATKLKKPTTTWFCCLSFTKNQQKKRSLKHVFEH